MTLWDCSRRVIRLQWQIPHIFLSLCSKGHGLTIVLTIPGLHLEEDIVADYVANIVGQFGTSAFHVAEVVLDVIVELLKGCREAFVESVTNLALR